MVFVVVVGTSLHTKNTVLFRQEKAVVHCLHGDFRCRAALWRRHHHCGNFGRLLADPAGHPAVLLSAMKINHTSREEIGQVYIGTVNWALMTATIILVIGFEQSTNLAAA
jgi:hypothetical protein